MDKWCTPGDRADPTEIWPLVLYYPFLSRPPNFALIKVLLVCS